jgi:hypothetical protein
MQPTQPLNVGEMSAHQLGVHLRDTIIYAMRHPLHGDEQWTAYLRDAARPNDDKALIGDVRRTTEELVKSVPEPGLYALWTTTLNGQEYLGMIMGSLWLGTEALLQGTFPAFVGPAVGTQQIKKDVTEGLIHAVYEFALNELRAIERQQQLHA